MATTTDVFLNECPDSSCSKWLLRCNTLNPTSSFMETSRYADSFAFFFLRSFFDFLFLFLGCQPENILLVGDDKFPQLKLTDFASAKVCRSTIVTSGIYTKNYVDTRRLVNEGRKLMVNESSDCWSFAVIAYACVTGEYPRLCCPDPDNPDLCDVDMDAAFDPQMFQVSQSLKDLLVLIFSRQAEKTKRPWRSKIISHEWFNNGLPRHRQLQPSHVDDPMVEEIHKLWCDLKVLEHRLGLDKAGGCCCWTNLLRIDQQMSTFAQLKGYQSNNDDVGYWQAIGCRNCCPSCLT